MSNEVIYKVSQVSDYIKKIVDNEPNLKYISMYGEVSGVSLSGGNIYFSLKDENALLSCISFGTKFSETIKNGDKLVVTGSVKFYAKAGKITVTVINCKPYGIGELYKQFLELKEKLKNEGLFDLEHKKPIPKLVKRIGVVTSSTGAVIQDIINIRTRRNDGVDIVVYPVKVQGVGADIQIAEGINFFSNYENIDVVIVARGGGSFEDLMPFNSEVVARATYNCKKPIISAIGHETDFTIIDFVSDLRAPTPSAGVELAVMDKSMEVSRLKSVIERIYKVIDLKIESHTKSINKDTMRIVKFFDSKIEMSYITLKTNFKLIHTYINNATINRANNLVSIEKLLNANNPANILKRGYAIIQGNDKVVSSIDDIVIGDNVTVTLSKGKFEAKVLNKLGDKKWHINLMRKKMKD